MQMSNLNNKRRYQQLYRRILLLITGLVAAGLLVGCDKEPATTEITATNTQPPTFTLLPTSLIEASVTPAPTTPAPTATLEPHQWTVSSGETLYFILQQLGYNTLDVVPEVLVLNNMASENDLVANQVLLVPRQTPTPGPTPTLIPTSNNPDATPFDPNVTPNYQGCNLSIRCLSLDGLYWMHEVQEGETVAGIAYAYDTTIQDIFRDNGLNENSFINPGDILRVFIRVTLTPTLTPTGGPDSTATALPTLSPPSLLAPANGASIARGETVVLQWAAVQPISSNHVYLVEIRDTSSEEVFEGTSYSNVFYLPEELRPGAGQSITYEWSVTVIEQSTEQVVSGTGQTYQFHWGN